LSDQYEEKYPLTASEKFHYPLVAKMKLNPSGIKWEINYENYGNYLSYESVYKSNALFIGIFQNYDM
jgi:hypothetical protein